MCEESVRRECEKRVCEEMNSPRNEGLDVNTGKQRGMVTRMHAHNRQAYFMKDRTHVPTEHRHMTEEGRLPMCP